MNVPARLEQRKVPIRLSPRDYDVVLFEGKPAPDAFLEAARRVGSEPSRAAAVEGAIAGVKARRAGRFGCVIGVDRRGQARALREAGVDVVGTDLTEVQVAVEPSSAWSLVYEDFDVAKEGIREALCTLGNGYFATRGSAAGAVADGIHDAGIYLASGYNRLSTEIAGRVVENEDLVKDGQGRESTLKDRWLVPMGSMHLGALELTLTADNWSAGVTVRSAIDGRGLNAGAKLYRKFNNKHLEPSPGRS